MWVRKSQIVRGGNEKIDDLVKMNSLQEIMIQMIWAGQNRIVNTENICCIWTYDQVRYKVESGS